MNIPFLSLKDATDELRAELDEATSRVLSSGHYIGGPEVEAFERPEFSVERWIDEKLQTPAYAERMRAVYMDLLRLEVSSAVNFNPSSIVLRRQRILGPGGAPTYVYYRQGQRRARAETDGDFCFTRDEAGFVKIGRAHV